MARIKPTKLSPETIAEAQRLYLSGMNPSQVSRAVGESRQALMRYLNQAKQAGRPTFTPATTHAATLATLPVPPVAHVPTDIDQLVPLINAMAGDLETQRGAIRDRLALLAEAYARLALQGNIKAATTALTALKAMVDLCGLTKLPDTANDDQDLVIDLRRAPPKQSPTPPDPEPDGDA